MNANERLFEGKLNNRVANALAIRGYKSLNEVKKDLLSGNLHFNGKKIVFIEFKTREASKSMHGQTPISLGQSSCDLLLSVLKLNKEKLLLKHTSAHHLKKCIDYLSMRGYKIQAPEY